MCWRHHEPRAHLEEVQHGVSVQRLLGTGRRGLQHRQARLHGGGQREVVAEPRRVRVALVSVDGHGPLGQQRLDELEHEVAVGVAQQLQPHRNDGASVVNSQPSAAYPDACTMPPRHAVVWEVYLEVVYQRCQALPSATGRVGVLYAHRQPVTVTNRTAHTQTNIRPHKGRTSSRVASNSSALRWSPLPLYSSGSSTHLRCARSCCSHSST